MRARITQDMRLQGDAERRKARGAVRCEVLRNLATHSSSPLSLSALGVSLDVSYYCPTVEVNSFQYVAGLIPNLDVPPLPLASAGSSCGSTTAHGDPPIVTTHHHLVAAVNTRDAASGHCRRSRASTARAYDAVGNAVPVSCGARSTTERARTASTVAVLGAAAGGGPGEPAAFVVSWAAAWQRNGQRVPA